MITSSYEKTIIDILNKEGIKFSREKTFDDLKNGLYRFDFYLPDKNILIKCDGEQHYHFTKAFYKKREDFLKSKERDRKKNAYALSHNIQLYRIPFFKMDSIKTFNDMTNKEFLVISIYHNDRVKVE